MSKTISFRATRRWIDRPIRTCRSLHHCAVCDKPISLGQRYFDGGYGRRAHESCVDIEAEKAAQANEQAAMGSIVTALSDNPLRGFRRGREYTELEVRDLPVGTVVWILYCKDDNPEYERFNGAYQITATDNDACGTGAFEAHDGEVWEYHGDTSRGIAHYFEAEPKQRKK